MGIPMKTMLFSAPLLLVSTLAHSQGQEPAQAYLQERVIASAFELSGWCEQEARRRYTARSVTPYQWTSSYYDRSDVLYVDGRIRVHGETIVVSCRIARGAQERYAAIEIDDPKL